MAWDFAAEIHALAGFDGDSETATDTSGEYFTLHVNQWLKDGVREVINNLSANLLEKCSDKTSLTDNSGLDLGTATVGKVLYCTRSNGTYEKPCRIVSGSNAGLTEDPNASSHYATSDDPAYFIKDNKVEIKPNPTVGEPGNVYHVLYPTIVYTDTSITNFPDEAEYLVVLYASIRAVQEKLANETINEDAELYALHSDKYAKLSAEYVKGMAVVKGG
jgi:hypothetical protein